MSETGTFYPIKNPNTSECGWRAECDYFTVSGFLETELHPDKLSVSDNGIDFEYSVGDNAESRTVTHPYVFAKSGGKISSVTFPNGHIMEVVRK